jgi:hypothetical protein
MDPLPNFGRVHTILTKNAEPIEVHQPGNHNFNEICSVFPVLSDMVGKFFAILAGNADKAAVVSRFAKRRQGGAVDDAVPGRKFSCPLAHIPTVTAIPEVGKAQILIALKNVVNIAIYWPACVPGNGILPIDAVQKHMDMAISLQSSHFLSFGIV